MYLYQLLLIVLLVAYAQSDTFRTVINRGIAFVWCAFGDTVDAIVASRKDRNS